MKIKRIILILALGILLVSAFACVGGPEATPTPTPTPTAGLSIENVEICSDVRGDRDYTIRGNGIFQLGDRVYVYFEVFGFRVQSTDGKYEVWFKVSNVELYDPDDELVLSQADLIDLHSTQLEEVPPYVWAEVHFDIEPGEPAGQYRAEITVEDMISGETASTTGYFTME